MYGWNILGIFWCCAYLVNPVLEKSVINKDLPSDTGWMIVFGAGWGGGVFRGLERKPTNRVHPSRPLENRKADYGAPRSTDQTRITMLWQLLLLWYLYNKVRSRRSYCKTGCATCRGCRGGSRLGVWHTERYKTVFYSSRKKIVYKMSTTFHVIIINVEGCRRHFIYFLNQDGRRKKKKYIYTIQYW